MADKSVRGDVDTSLCSDIDDFEKVSIPCSEPVSDDEAVETASDRECTTPMKQMLAFTVHKPPAVSAGVGRGRLRTFVNSIDQMAV